MNKRIVLVAGGTGNVGIGIVNYFLQKGDTVIVPSRNKSKTEMLSLYVKDSNKGELVVIPLNIGDDIEARHLIEKIEKGYARIDIAVASLGGWWTGQSVTKVSIADWDKIMHNNLTTHFNIARHTLAFMQKQRHGTYISIAGPGNVLLIPQSSLMSIIGAAQVAMAKLFAMEVAGHGVKYFQLFIAKILTRERTNNSPQRKPGWILPEDIGAYAEQLYNNDNTETVYQMLLGESMPEIEDAIRKSYE